MPGMNGFELLDEIRTLGPDAGNCIPVIAMTAFADRAPPGCRLAGLFTKAVHSRRTSGDDRGFAQRLAQSPDGAEGDSPFFQIVWKAKRSLTRS
jgi:CheY-like chemotaxis protein